MVFRFRTESTKQRDSYTCGKRGMYVPKSASSMASELGNGEAGKVSIVRGRDWGEMGPVVSSIKNGFNVGAIEDRFIHLPVRVVRRSQQTQSRSWWYQSCSSKALRRLQRWIPLNQTTLLAFQIAAIANQFNKKFRNLHKE